MEEQPEHSVNWRNYWKTFLKDAFWLSLIVSTLVALANYYGTKQITLSFYILLFILNFLAYFLCRYLTFSLLSYFGRKNKKMPLDTQEKA